MLAECKGMCIKYEHKYTRDPNRVYSLKHPANELEGNDNNTDLNADVPEAKKHARKCRRI
jgi:hypothetical protein